MFKLGFISNIFFWIFCCSVYTVLKIAFGMSFFYHKTLFFLDFAYIFTTWLKNSCLKEAEPSHLSISLNSSKLTFVYCASVNALITCPWPWNLAGLTPDWHRAPSLKCAVMTRRPGGPCVLHFLSVRCAHCLTEDSTETTLAIECNVWWESLVYQ